MQKIYKYGIFYLSIWWDRKRNSWFINWKAKEGIEVNLIIDGVNLANRKLNEYFKNTGVNLHLFFRTYIPIFNIRLNYRDHRKVTIIDNRVAFVWWNEYRRWIFR